MSFHILGTGSSANSYYFSDGETSILVDIGFSCRELERRLSSVGVSPDSIDYIFLTHTHSDHCKGVSLFSRKYSVPVVCNKYHSIDFEVFSFEYLPINSEASFGSISVRSFKTNHDSSGSVGFFINLGERSFSIITDTGLYSEDMLKFSAISDVLFLESNYDANMLASCSYPDFLKDRIASSTGHLSNKDSGDFIRHLFKYFSPRLERVYFCHLSDKSNSVELVENVMKDVFADLKQDGYCVDFVICPKGELIRGIYG